MVNSWSTPRLHLSILFIPYWLLAKYLLTRELDKDEWKASVKFSFGFGIPIGALGTWWTLSPNSFYRSYYALHDFISANQVLVILLSLIFLWLLLRITIASTPADNARPLVHRFSRILATTLSLGRSGLIIITMLTPVFTTYTHQGRPAMRRWVVGRRAPWAQGAWEPA